ncbi:MAG: thiamine-phosphate kinase [Actinomycetota bacterium]|nr:thiamine-phosphate kinase [Actinomycetota bacterium]
MTPPPVPSQPTASTAGTVAELGEFGLIEVIVPLFAQHPDVLVGPGDDAAVVAIGANQVLVSTDLLIENRHFRRDWSSAEDIGHKAAAANLSDLNAMGGRTTALVVALAIPGDLEVAWVRDLASGIAAEAALVGASVVGGDVTASDQVSIAVTVLGTCAAPVLRSGARAGDVVAVCGRLGWAGAGFHVLGRGFRSPRAVVEAHRRPRPPYSAGPEAASAGATAMIDLSDGLLADLGHVAAASGCSIDVQTAAFEVEEPLRAVGAALGLDPLQFVLTGGDDYALAATFPAGTTLPEGWTVVGRVAAGGAVVTVDGVAYDGPAGHEHFR